MLISNALPRVSNRGILSSLLDANETIPLIASRYDLGKVGKTGSGR